MQNSVGYDLMSTYFMFFHPAYSAPGYWPDILNFLSLATSAAGKVTVEMFVVLWSARVVVSRVMLL